MVYNNEHAIRYTIAAARLLMQELAPEFANDTASLTFVAGPLLGADAALDWALGAQQSQVDIVYLAFEPGRERFGPVNVSVFAERSGIVHRWLDCDLWAPKHGGTLLIFPKALKMCFSHDGLALISHEARPTQSVRTGLERARARLARAARAVTPEEVNRVLAKNAGKWAA